MPETVAGLRQRQPHLDWICGDVGDPATLAGAEADAGVEGGAGRTVRTGA